MTYKVGDIVELKRMHPCGSNKWEIIKVGMDIKLRCFKCHHIIIMSRRNFEESLVEDNPYDQVADEKENEKNHHINNMYEPTMKEYINRLPQGKLKKRIRNNPHQIKYVDNPSVELQRLVISKDYSFIKYISNIHPSIIKELYDDVHFDISKLDKISQRRLREAFDKLDAVQSYNNAVEKEETSKIMTEQLFVPEDTTPTSEIRTQEIMEVSSVQEQDIYKEKLIEEIWESMVREMGNGDYAIRLVDSKICIDSYLNGFAHKINIKAVDIASGFVYKSGLKSLEKMFQRVRENKGEIRIVIGSLKDYFHSSTDHKLINIDLDTAKKINEMLEQYRCKLYTLESKFYHGKYYFLMGNEMSCCLIGSSNVTASGFSGNYELNTLYLLKNNSEMFTRMQQWFLDFKKECTEIKGLVECNFTDFQMPFDTLNANTNIIAVDINTIKKEVQGLSDEEVKFRLGLWLEKEPDNIYRRLEIESLKDYVAFEYKERNLIVFESFEAANGYYYFYNENIFEVVQRIRELSKAQIFNISNMEKRGYHIKDREVLKKKINGLFDVN